MQTGSGPAPVHLFMAAQRFKSRQALLALALVAFFTTAASAQAARSVYFADMTANSIAQFAVGPGGSLTALAPGRVGADGPRRLAMTPTGADLYATADDSVLQFDVGAGGQLTAKAPALVAAIGDPHSIAVHPAGHSAYVTDPLYGKVRQYTIGPGGVLVPKDPPSVFGLPAARGVAVSPGGAVLYVLVSGGIAVLDIDATGALTRRPGRVAVPSTSLEDLALTPDGRYLYATSQDRRVFQFGVGADGTPTPMSVPSLLTPLGAKPIGIAVAPDASVVYVAAQGVSPTGARRVLTFAVGAGGALSAGADAVIAGAGFKLWYLSTSPDGKHLFVGGDDGHLFDLGPGPLLAPADPAKVDLSGAHGVVVSPNQAPVASFAPGPAAAGAPVRFDASAASDPDGTIVRYDWDFGDGTVLPDGGPTPEHIYASPGTYVVTLVVTDNEGASTATVFTGGTVLGNGTPGAQATQVVLVEEAPVVVPAQAPVPDLGETLVATPVRGIVFVRPRGAKRFVELANVQELPLGSVLDTRRGRVRVATERRRRGLVQDGVFYGGRFAVRQRKRDRFVTELVLRGVLDPCAEPGKRASAARAKRRLWGNANGKFRTRGRYSSGAVRGTRWLTQDSCAGTLTSVRQGVVAVRDFRLGRTVVVQAGESYIARPR